MERRRRRGKTAGSTSAAPFPSPSRSAVTFRKGYGLRDLRADVLAGVVVGIVALPLSMALAIAVGVPPQHGLYTAIVAGLVVSLLGGCKFQVTGPTAAFVVILAPVVNRHGLSGLLTAGLMAGVLLVAMGLLRVGSLIKFIPYPVTTGFTAGIATVIATLQVKALLGLSVKAMPDHYVEKVAVLWQARATASAAEIAVAAGTFALLIGIPKVTQRIPAPLIAIALASAGAAVAHRTWPSLSIATIGSRFHTVVGGTEIAGIPPLVPTPSWPWGRSLSYDLIRELFPSAFAIAMLGAIESLLSAVIADGMTGTKHDPNAELVGLGIGNAGADLRRNRRHRSPGAHCDEHPRGCPLAHRMCDAFPRGAPRHPGARSVGRLRADGVACRAAHPCSLEHVGGAPLRRAPQDGATERHLRAADLLGSDRVLRHGRGRFDRVRPCGDPVHAADGRDNGSEAGDRQHRGASARRPAAWGQPLRNQREYAAGGSATPSRHQGWHLPSCARPRRKFGGRSAGRLRTKSDYSSTRTEDDPARLSEPGSRFSTDSDTCNFRNRLRFL